MPLANQVQNPVSLLPQDNNGVLVQLPQVASSGAASVDGVVYLGIGTRSNNVPASGTSTYGTNSRGNFTTTFDGKAYTTSFIDSGSNGIFFPTPSSGVLAKCTATTSWFCVSPGSTSPQQFTAITAGASGSVSNTVPFEIADEATLASSGNYVFSNLGGCNTATFDWGLPFFFGRNVFVGIDGKSSTLGTGPYWAY